MYYAHLTQRARYQIEQLIQEATPVRLIARKLAVHRSTIYRELKRGCRVARQYAAAHAQAAAERRARRLLRQWSPEEIRERARLLGQPFASVPAIYAWIRRQRTRGRTFHRHLRYLWRRERRLQRWATLGLLHPTSHFELKRADRTHFAFPHPSHYGR